MEKRIKATDNIMAHQVEDEAILRLYVCMHVELFCMQSLRSSYLI